MADSSLRHKLGAIISSPENRSKIPVILLMEAAAQLGESAIFEYIVVQELSNTKLFICEVKVGRVLKCHGRGPNKRTAKAKAAENALEMIREMTGLRRYSPQVSTWQGQDTPKTEKVNVLEEDLKLAGKSKKPMDLEVSTAKDVKKKKHKLRFKDMDKRSSEKGNDLMEAYTEKPFQEEIPDDRQTPQPQPEFKEAVEDVLSEDETWEDKEDSWFPELDEVADKAKLTYGRDFLLQLQTHPISMLRPEGLPDSEVFLGQARTPSRTQKPDGRENMFLPAFMRQQSKMADDRQTPQPQPEFEEAVEDILSEDETWEDKEEFWSPELDGVACPSRAGKAKLTYGRDFLLQLQTHPISMLRPEGLPDLEVVLGQARTPSRSTYHQTRIPDDDLNMSLPDATVFRRLSKGEDESKTWKANVHEEDLKLSDESQKPTDTEVTVPSEIQARAQLAYIDVLKNGKVKVYRTRIMLLGQDRAGKTSLKKSFLGLPFDHGEPSTDGITVDQSKFEINVDQVKNWMQTGEKPFVSQFANDLAKMVADKLKNEQAVLENEVDQVMTVEQTDENEDVPQSANDFAKILTEQAEGGDEDNFEDQYRRKKAPNRDETATNVATDVSTVQEEIEGKEAIISDPALPPEEFTQFLVQHWQGLSLQSEVASIENYMTLDLWDFAGQHLYYSSYPVFLSSRAVYMLVYNMSKDLQDTAKPCVRVGNVDSHLKNPNGETNLENLLSWLLTVVTMCAGQPTANYVRPPVFIVGTHADQPCQDIKEMESHIKMALYGNDLDHHIIREGVIQNYFSVDNRLGSSCSGVRTLQKKIIEVLKQEPYMGEEVPARWFLFEKVIQALVTESKKYSLNRKLLNKIIKKYCFIDDEDEVDKMLNFYHGLGIIVRHGSTVVLQSQWLIDVFRQLITIRSYKDMGSRYSRFWKDLEDTGVLSMQLVDFVFSKLGQQGVIRKDILAMMEQFGLIVKFQYPQGDEQYFVPSLLKTPPDPLCNQEPSPADPCALYITFLGGFVPHGLYTQLVSRCTEWCSDRGVQYAPDFFDGASRFVVEKEFLHQLILLSKKKFIKISLRLRESSDQDAATEAETARLVLGFLEDALQSMTQEVPWFQNLKYKLCVECPYCPKDGCRCRKHGKVSCNHEDCICLLTLPARAQPVYCKKSFRKESLKAINMDKWFSVKGIEMPACAPSKSGSPVYTPPQSKKVKEGNPSNYELEVLSQKIIHWKSLGRRLNFCAADLHGFDNENSEWREKAYAMLLKWKQREGRDATYKVLYEALCNECVQRTDLAQEFCCHVEGKTVTSGQKRIR